MDKKTHILNCAADCFATNGYHETTIQHIADAAGIAKGGIYFYFKSKEELLLSVFADYYDRLFKNVTEAAARYAHDPKEGLIQQILAQFQELSRSNNFFMIFSREQVANAEIKKIGLDMRTRFFVWFRDQIIAVYGPRIEPYAFDLSAMLTSLIREYMGFRIINNAPLPVRGVSEYIFARLDDAARGVLSTQEPPMLTTSFVKSIFPDANIAVGTDAARRLSLALSALQSRVDGSTLPEESRRAVRDAANLMHEELSISSPRKLILLGMAALIKETLREKFKEDVAGLHAIIYDFT
ncbi:TetR/AcrR family transcriptional regulator [Paenibacillus sp. TRM 82003]|nr:TetR/AcrR family transcriptional regulator [Paenibacillus sp. TRM 82003]